MAQTVGRNDSRYRASREQLKKTDRTCHNCGQPIDMQLKWPHPLSWSADHIVPHSRLKHLPKDHPAYWHVRFLRASHLRCNEARGNKPARPATATVEQRDLNTSHDWTQPPGAASNLNNLT